MLVGIGNKPLDGSGVATSQLVGMVLSCFFHALYPHSHSATPHLNVHVKRAHNVATSLVSRIHEYGH